MRQLPLAEQQLEAASVAAAAGGTLAVVGTLEADTLAFVPAFLGTDTDRTSAGSPSAEAASFAEDSRAVEGASSWVGRSLLYRRSMRLGLEFQ